MSTQQELIEKAIVGIMETYGLNRESVERLFELTSEKNGQVRFVSIKGYNSDKSLNTEVANHLVTINANYENTKEKSLIELNSPNQAIKDMFLIFAEGWDYEGKYNLEISVSDFRKQVEESFEIALIELRNPKTASEIGRVNNDIHIEGTPLYFNTNTLRLSIMGISQQKKVEQQGIFKKVKSAPKTVAKQIINKVVEPKNDKIRRFAIDNLGAINLFGETLEIGGGQTDGIEIKG